MRWRSLIISHEIILHALGDFVPAPLLCYAVIVLRADVRRDCTSSNTLRLGPVYLSIAVHQQPLGLVLQAHCQQHPQTLTTQQHAASMAKQSQRSQESGAARTGDST